MNDNSFPIMVVPPPSVEVHTSQQEADWIAAGPPEPLHASDYSWIIGAFVLGIALFIIHNLEQ